VIDEDPEPIANSAEFRCVIARDGSAWLGRTYGTHMPEEGAEARSSSLEGLKDEAQGQAGAACQQATGGHLSSSSWSYEYALGESTDGKLEAFRQARMAVWQAQRDGEERGHQAAADLAAAHSATLPEIADILEVCCSAEAAELLDYNGVQVVFSELEMILKSDGARPGFSSGQRCSAAFGWAVLVRPATSVKVGMPS